MIGSTSRSRRRTTGYTNPYAAAAAAQSSQRSVPQRYANPFAGQPANQPPQDPLVSAIAGGSTGGGFNDTITPTGINTNASGAFQEQTQGKVAGNTPANMPPPLPPPPPPPTMAQMQAPQTQNNLLPQGGMTSDQHQQALRMNNQPTGNAFDPNAGNAMALAQAARRPANQPFNDTVTPTGRSTEVATSAPRDLPSMAEAQGAGQAPTLSYGEEMAMRQNAANTAMNNRLGDALRSGMSYGEEMAARQGGGTPPAPFDDTVTPTGRSTEVSTSTPRDLPSMAEAQAAQMRQPSMTADDYRSMLRGETQGIRDAIVTADDYNRLLSGAEDRITSAINADRMTADDYQNILRGETQGIRDAIVTADDYNRLLSGQGDRIVEAVNQGRMTADDYRNILRGEIAGIGSGAMTADEYGRLSSGMEDRLTQAIGGQMTADDYNRILSGESNRIIEATTAGRMSPEDYQSMLRGETQGIRDSMMTADDYRNVLRGELTARDEQARQAEIAAEQDRQREQAGLDMQRAQAAQATNDRMRELLQGYAGGTSAQRDMMMAQAPNFQQRELLRRAESRLQAPSGATDAQAAMFAAQRPTELPDVSGFRSSYADAAAAQGGGGATPTGYTNPYADAAARQPDTGLRTFSSQPRFSPMRQGVDRPSDTLQQRLEREYLGRIDSADDPILASQIADQQLRQQEAQKGLVEQLSRYGVLRGGGDTAAALTRMAEGDERNRLALEAAAAQRRQGDLRDALAFDQTRAQMGLAERGQTLQERRGQEDILNQQLSRQLQQAGVTGQFQGQDTLQAQQQRQQMDLAERGTALQEQLGGETILDRQQGRDIAAAGLTGRFGDADTLAGRELSLREELARSGDLRAQQAAESELFGQVVTGTDAPITTLQGQRIASDLDTAGLAREATEAGLTGQFRGGATATERALESQLASDDLARQIQEAGVTGQYGDQETLQSQVIESSLQNEALNRGLARAGATGLFREEGDTGAGTETLESRLRTAGLTGELGGQLTLGGRQAEQDLIGSILAASDPEMLNRTDALATALTGKLAVEEQRRMEANFLNELEQLGDDMDFDSFFQLAEKYGNVPSIADALLEVQDQNNPSTMANRIKELITGEG
jgi:hypothetical protein